MNLVVENLLQVHRADNQEDAEDRHAERNLVADDLRRRSQRAEQRVFAVRRPAAEDDAVNDQAANRKGEEDADIEAGGDGESRVRMVLDELAVELLGSGVRRRGWGNRDRSGWRIRWAK